MKRLFLLFMFISVAASANHQPAGSRYYELRIYYCHPGRLDALLARFQNHTTRLFEKHGMVNEGYWLPVNNEKNALYYILSYPSKEARDQSWKAFGSDPDWRKVQTESEADGKIVASVVSMFMNYSDIVPLAEPWSKQQPRLFELRTYTCLPNRLPNLITRFKDHTVKLFEKHGMENIVYFESIEAEGQPKLVYLLAHQSEAAAKQSWDGFRNDPTWIAARDASEKDGKIVEKIESVYLVPLAFSKWK